MKSVMYSSRTTIIRTRVRDKKFELREVRVKRVLTESEIFNVYDKTLCEAPITAV